VDLIHILKAFEKGADGVYVAGCIEGSCQYTSGNIRARKRVEQAKEILDKVGVGGERVEMYNLSSAEGHRFAEIASEMTEKIRGLGANPARAGASSRTDRAPRTRDRECPDPLIASAIK